jgi:replicative DNA helicase
MTTTQSERYLVGAMLLDAGLCHDAIRMVSGKDFTDPDLGGLFDELVILSQTGKPVSDNAYVFSVLGHTKPFQNLGVGTIIEILGEIPHAGHATYHAELVQKASQRRTLQLIGARLSSIDQSDDPSDIAESIQSDLVALSESNAGREVFDAGDCVGTVLERIREAQATGIVPGLTTGIKCVDAAVGTMQPTQLIVLAARTSIGKTAFAVSVAVHNAKMGKSVLYVSLEMDAYAMGARFIAYQTGLSAELLESGQLHSSQLAAVESAEKTVKAWPLHIFVPTKMTVGTIGSYARCHAAKHGLDLVIVDHAGLLRTSKQINAYEQAGRIVEDLKAMARALKQPVLALYQPNRKAEGEMPKLDDLRDSGKIEDTADKVWFIHRKRESNFSEFRVAKYRNGTIGDIDQGLLFFNPNRCTYQDAPTGEHWQA